MITRKNLSLSLAPCTSNRSAARLEHRDLPCTTRNERSRLVSKKQGKIDVLALYCQIRFTTFANLQLHCYNDLIPRHDGNKCVVIVILSCGRYEHHAMAVRRCGMDEVQFLSGSLRLSVLSVVQKADPKLWQLRAGSLVEHIPMNVRS